jgi:hypothetical protein
LEDGDFPVTRCERKPPIQRGLITTRLTECGYSPVTCGNIVDKSVGITVKYCFLIDELQIAFFVITIIIFNNIKCLQ